MTTTAFFILAPITILSAIAVILWKNPIASALSLVVTLSSLALFYFLLSAPFVGVLQILVYAGAIMVLFIFVIMLINLKDEELEPLSWSFGKIFTLLVLGAAIGAAGFGLWKINLQSPLSPSTAPLSGSIQEVGQALFSRYSLSFELVSFVILAAIIGAVALARRDSHQGGDRP